MRKKGLLARAFTMTVVCASIASLGVAPCAIAATPAQDRATAQAINLASKDLPGWLQSPATNNSSDQRLSKELSACVGAPNPSTADAAHISSPYFDNGNASVSSDVTMMRTRGAGQADLAAMRRPKTVRCLDKLALPYFKAQFPTGTTISAFRVDPLRPSWLPTNGYGYRLSMVVSSKPKGPGATLRIGIVADGIRFLSGRAEVELSVTQGLSGVPSAALEQRLTSTLVARAEREAHRTS
jgi:hypothetical protein